MGTKNWLLDLVVNPQFSELVGDLALDLDVRYYVSAFLEIEKIEEMRPFTKIKEFFVHANN